MTVGSVPSIRRAALPGSDAEIVAAAVGEYLRLTEAEKASQGLSPALDDDERLPERYRGEVDHPAVAYHGFHVLIAEVDGVVAGVVVAAPEEPAEIKRLWTAPELRGRGVGSALLDAAVAATEGDVRLSVWDWRTGAIRLYESRGFVQVPSWDGRDRLICMVRKSR